MRVSQCQLHVPNAFGGMAGLEVDASHIFPWGVLAVIMLLGHWTRNGGADTKYEVELPLYSVATTALSWGGSEPKLLEQKP